MSPCQFLIGMIRLGQNELLTIEMKCQFLIGMIRQSLKKQNLTYHIVSIPYRYDTTKVNDVFYLNFMCVNSL